jgi:hypothetical protein
LVSLPIASQPGKQSAKELEQHEMDNKAEKAKVEYKGKTQEIQP